MKRWLQTATLFLLSSTAFSATCNLPAGTYTLSTSSSSWSCGHVPVPADTVTMAAGGVTLTVDQLAWTVGNFNGSGTSSSFNTFISVSSGEIISNGDFRIDYGSFSVLGSSITDAVGCTTNRVNGTCQLTHSVLNGCGMVDFNYGITFMDPTIIVRVDSNTFSNSPGLINFQITGIYADTKTTGVREVIGNVFDRNAGSWNGEGWSDVTFTGNYAGEGVGPFTLTGGTNTTTNNFLHLDNTLNPQINFRPDSLWTNNYFMSDFHLTNAVVGGGLHPFFPNEPVTFNHIVIDVADRTNSDSSDMMDSSLGNTLMTWSTQTWTNVIQVPDAVGDVSGQMTSKQGTTSTFYDYRNNTTYGNNGLGPSMCRWAETAEAVPHEESCMNSILWSPPGTGGEWYAAADLGAINLGSVPAISTDVCTAATCDYNWTYGYTEKRAGNPASWNEANGYVGIFTSTPGVHDIHGNPQFIDYQRSAALWDTKYLQHYALPWNSTTTYNIGDVVVSTVSGTYWGYPINYYRSKVTCSSPTVIPGTMNSDQNPSGWRDDELGCWQYASLSDIRNAVSTNTIITDPSIPGCSNGCSYITALQNWVTRGYTPTNEAIRGAAKDGTDMGAVPLDPIVTSTYTAPLVISTENAGGTAINVDIPGYFSFQFGSGDTETNLGDYHGLIGFWDLKNDPTKQYNFGALFTGMMQWKWALNNASGPVRPVSGGGGTISSSPGYLTVLETNNVRTKFRYTYREARFGFAGTTTDPNVTNDEYYTVYPPNKVYQTIKFNYDNLDGNAPLSFSVMEDYPKVSWMHISNEGPTTQQVQTTPCGANIGLSSPAPFEFVYQDTTTYQNKTYMMYDPHSTYMSENNPFPDNCAGLGNPGAPTPGVVSVCTNSQCQPAGISGHVAIKPSFLFLMDPFSLASFEGLSGNGTVPQYFAGFRSAMEDQNIFSSFVPFGRDSFELHTAMFGGDTGITTKAVAQSYSDEYRGPSGLIMSSGTNNGFSYENGDFEISVATDFMKAVSTGTMTWPAFNISGWTGGLLPKVSTGSTVLVPSRDYTYNISNSTALIQILSVLPAGSTITVASVSCPGPGTCYYFDPTKSGSGIGTAGNPYGMADTPVDNNCTQRTMTTSLNPGDWLFFLPGASTQPFACAAFDQPFLMPTQDGLPGKPITFSGIPGMAAPNLTMYTLGPRQHSYFRMSDMVIVSTGIAGGQYWGIVGAIGTGNELDHMEYIGADAGADTDNHDGIELHQQVYGHIHNNKVHGYLATGSANPSNSNGIKSYTCQNMTIENNWTYNNYGGMYDKDGDVGNIWRSNLIQTVGATAWSGPIQDCAQSPTFFQCQAQIYDNVMTGQVDIGGGVTHAESTGTIVRNNLFINAIQAVGIGESNQMANTVVFNNVMTNPTVPLLNAVSTTFQVIASTPAPPFSYIDYNLYDSANVPYTFNLFGSPQQFFTLATMQTNSPPYETHSSTAATSAIFVDTVNYALKDPYTYTGRYGDPFGPRDTTVQQILEQTQYGPFNSLPTPPPTPSTISSILKGRATIKGNGTIK